MSQVKITDFLETFFDQYVKKKSLFVNRKVLTDSYIPETILHREEQIKQLTAILAPALRLEKPSNVFLYGKTGTGKTLTAKYVSIHLERAAQKYNVPVKILYVNCKMKKVSDTEYRVIANLIHELGGKVPSTGLPLDILYRKFFELLDKKEQVVIIILDEIDHLVKKAGDEVLYNLTRINSELQKAQVSFVGISNSLTFLDDIDPRIKSSLDAEEILFPPYNAQQLKDILYQRAKLAFREGVIEEGVIEKIAAIAAREHGDARKALELLRLAGEIAEREGAEKITLEHVDKALEKLETDTLTELIRSLPKQAQLVLFAILRLVKDPSEKTYTGKVYEEYTKVCKEIGLPPLTQRRVSDIIAELDMLGIINAKVISRGRYGRTREITINFSDKVYEKIVNLLKEEFL